MSRHKGRRPSRVRKCFTNLKTRLKTMSDALVDIGVEHPLRVGIGLGAFLMVVLLILGPVLVPALARGSEDWFSYWTGWLPGVCSVGLSFSSISITVYIAKEQTKQSKMLNEMQTRLTLAANLPSIYVSSVEFYSRDECIKQTSNIDLLEMGPRLYRFNIFFPAEAFPANYKVVLEKVLWDFPKPPPSKEDEASCGTLEPNDFTMHIFRSGHQAKLQLDFWCQKEQRFWFNCFYSYPKLPVPGENSVKLTLRLRMDDLLLNAVMEGAGLAVRPGRDVYAGRMDLNLLLSCKQEYMAGAPPYSPMIVVDDHSISVPRQKT